MPILDIENLQLPNSSPARIISLVPSLTELLYYLELDDKVVGITKFCVHPNEWFRKKQRIGGTKTLNIEVIKNLIPDLIIANKEENVKEQVEELQTLTNIYLTDVNTLQDALQMIAIVGQLVNKEEKAAELVQEIKDKFKHLQPLKRKLKTAYLIWKNPYMAAGGDTYINNLMSACNFDNILKNTTRYPIVTLQQLQKAECELLLLSTEPYPFKKEHIEELQPNLPNTKILLVDGEMFSWYGSRLLMAAQYFKELIGQLHH